MQPGIIILEGIVKLIIKTYFVHNVKLLETDESEFSPEAEPKEIHEEIFHSDMGDYKIQYCIAKLLEVVNELAYPNSKSNRQSTTANSATDKGIELQILLRMVNSLEDADNKRLLNKDLFKKMKEGFDLISKTNSPDALKEIEQNIIYKEFIGNINKIDDIIKTVTLRLPGAAIIESVSPPSILSTAESRQKRERSDGTNEFSECILVPSEKPEIWNVNHKAQIPLSSSELKDISSKNISVFFYPYSKNVDDVYFKRAVNLFEKLANSREVAVEIR